MKVIILGSGVIGTASAYFLAKAGHDVTVVDRQPGAGMETSFGNAAYIKATGALAKLVYGLLSVNLVFATIGLSILL